MPTRRKPRWATNFFMWSAIIALVLDAFPIFDQWSRRHVVQPSSLEALAEFVGYMAGGLVVIGGPFIFALVNGLVLRRYQSRIAAALFTIFGLLGIGWVLLLLLGIGFESTAVAMVVFYGAYFAIAVWTFVALVRQHSQRKVASPLHANAAREDRKDWFAHTPPWDRMAPKVIDAILDGIADKVLLEAFVLTSTEKGLAAKYEPLGWDHSDATVIRAQISQILCDFGHRTIASLVKALEEKQTDAAGEIMFSAANAFESAIALAKNQIAAYAGLAELYRLDGDITKSHYYAQGGLVELEEMQRHSSAQALPKSALFPADITDQMERLLCSYLELPARKS